MSSDPQQLGFDGADGARRSMWLWPAEVEVGSVLLIHGYAEHAGRYDRTARILADGGFRVVAPDLLGHGRSAGERASVPTLGALTDDARRARAAALPPAGPLFVLGHSMGGLAATSLVIETPAPFAGLVVSGPAVGDPVALELVLRAEELPEVVLDPALLAADPSVGRAYDADPLNYRGPFRRETLESLCSGARTARARWSEIGMPALILHGADDAIVDPTASQELHAGIGSRDRQLRILPGLRHEILNESAGPALAAEIRDWMLARLPGRR